MRTNVKKFQLILIQLYVIPNTKIYRIKKNIHLKSNGHSGVEKHTSTYLSFKVA